MVFRILYAAALLLGIDCCQVCFAAPLKLCYEDVPQAPWTMPDGRGLNFQLLKRVEKQLGEQFEFVVKPWKRCLEEVKLGTVDGVVGAAYTADRFAYGIVPILPDGRPDGNFSMFYDRANVFMRAGSPVSWDGKKLYNPRGLVVVQRAYFIADLLRQRHQEVKEVVKSADEGLTMLAHNEADVAVLLGIVAEQAAKNDPRFSQHVTQAKIPLAEYPFFLLISRKTYALDRKRIDAIWHAIKSVRHSDEYQKLEANEIRSYR